jgi:hypothetical protein
LLKVASILYKAKKAIYVRDDFESANDLDISSRKQDVNQIKVLSNEIVETGLNVI